MAYSVDVKVATGSTNTFTFAFSGLNHGFLSEDDIHVYVEDVPREYELLSESMLTVTGAIIPAGSRVTIRRETQASMPVVDWIDGGQLNEQLLDNQTAQLLYLCQEALDGYAISDVWRDININGHTIRGIGMDRNDPTSAATVGFFEEVAERAEHAEAMADQYKEEASNSAVAAANSEGAASASADLARRWASEEEDVVVLDGKYSAYHHAQKAANEAADAAYDAQRAEDAADRSEATGGPATMDAMGIVKPKTGGDSGLLIASPGELEVVPATTDKLGGVRVGEGIAVEEDGTISVPPPPEINLATNATAGTVIVGAGLDITGLVEEGQDSPAPGTLSLAAHSDESGAKYGRGDSQFFGHVKLTDDFEQDADATSGISISPKGVKTAFNRVVGILGEQIITSSRTWVVPETGRYSITAVGGGGNGGSGGPAQSTAFPYYEGYVYIAASGGGGGGGGSGETTTLTTTLTKGASYTLTIGGSNGTTSFGAVLTARGGGTGGAGGGGTVKVNEGSNYMMTAGSGGGNGVSYGGGAGAGSVGKTQERGDSSGFTATGGGGGYGGVSVEGYYGSGGSGGTGGGRVSSGGTAYTISPSGGSAGRQGCIKIKIVPV